MAQESAGGLPVCAGRGCLIRESGMRFGSHTDRGTGLRGRRHRHIVTVICAAW
jgi:hypothetical protein